MEILLLEDEPLIGMDLEMACEDLGHHSHSARNIAEAMRVLDTPGLSIDGAVLDVSLQGTDTCLPVAQRLDREGVPYILHSGDLNRQNETVRSLQAVLVAKPACSTRVVDTLVEQVTAARDPYDRERRVAS